MFSQKSQLPIWEYILFVLSIVNSISCLFDLQSTLYRKRSKKMEYFSKNPSHIKELMSFGDPEYVRKLGIDPEKLISFAGGWSNHDAPENLRNAYNDIITDKERFHQSGSYSTSIGDRELRKMICKFENHLYGMNIDEKQIAIGLGSTQITSDLFSFLLDPGDKILLLDPTYSNYSTQLTNRAENIEQLHFSVIDEKNWEFIADEKIEEFSEFILENKPKVVLLVSPDNPTSKVLSQSFVQAALDSVKKIGGYLIIDFAYKELVFDKKLPEYFSWCPSDNFISLRTNSKWCRSLGRRIGWIEASEPIIQYMGEIQNSSILSPDKLHQMAFEKFLKDSIDDGSLDEYLERTRELYKKTSEKTVELIKKNLNFPIIIPDGGLYVFMNVKTDGRDFVKKILTESGVLLTPGWGFGQTGKNAVRLSFGPLVNEVDKIEIGIRKIGELF